MKYIDKTTGKPPSLSADSTTAGTITTGPFIEKLEVLHRMLEKEHDYVLVED